MSSIRTIDRVYKTLVKLETVNKKKVSAQEVSDLLEKTIKSSKIKISTINIIDEKPLEERIIKLSEKYNILAIISSTEIKIDKFEYISIVDLFSGQADSRLQEIIDEVDMYDKIWNSLSEHLEYFKSDLILKDIRQLINFIENQLGVKVNKEVKMGLVLYICFMIDSLIRGEKTKPFNNLKSFKENYLEEMLLIKKEFREIEFNYNIHVGEDEISYILKTFLENNLSVHSMQ